MGTVKGTEQLNIFCCLRSNSTFLQPWESIATALHLDGYGSEWGVVLFSASKPYQ